jgi:hypothetical protein
MKAGAVISLLLGLAGIATAGHVRVIVQVVEVPHAALTTWTAGESLPGREIHDRAMKLVATGEAEVVETSVLIARSGERAIVESIAELIFPSEYNPPGFDQLPLALMAGGLPAPFPHLRPAEVLSTSFETRNTGSTFEIEPTIGGGGKVVDLRVGFDFVDRAALATFTEFRDRWGDASVRMPIFDTRSMSISLTVTSGVFDLWNVFTPKPAAVPAATTRQLVFVRADVLPDHSR